MARPPRPQYEGAYYHVYNRGVRRAPLFHDDKDYFQFERYLAEAVRHSGLVVYAWCQMPNHFHFLVQTVQANLAEWMQRLTGRYAQYLNRRYKWKGHAFEGRYGAVLCDSDRYFHELIRYIHLNPYRSKRPLPVPADQWKWSSHRYYLGLTAPEPLQAGLDDGLLSFGSTRLLARRSYLKFLADGLSDGTWEDFYQLGATGILGDESFVERARSRAEAGSPLDGLVMPRESNLKVLLEATCQEFGVSEEILRSADQSHSVSRVRTAFVWAAVRLCRIKSNQVASFLNRKPTAIAMILKRICASEAKETFNARLRSAFLERVKE